MSSLIPRYSEFDADRMNASFLALQRRYEASGNALENISSGTLTAPTAQIPMVIDTTAYKYFRLLVSVKTNGLDNLNTLRFNNDASLVYYPAYLEGDGVSPSSFVSANLDFAPLIAQSVNFTTNDYWLFPTTTGCNLLSDYINRTAATTVQGHIGCVYSGGPILSLQVSAFYTPSSGGQFVAGSKWQLQGLRA